MGEDVKGKVSERFALRAAAALGASMSLIAFFTLASMLMRARRQNAVCCGYERDVSITLRILKVAQRAGGCGGGRAGGGGGGGDGGGGGGGGSRSGDQTSSPTAGLP